MQTQITCPSCNNMFAGEVHQIVDVGLQPELKEMLLNGYLNVVQCPSCTAVSRVGMPMLYHDPENELFMVYMPMEMNLSHSEREEEIGKLVKEAMDQLPAEQRRGYMFQPETLINQQTFLEKVLATEGVTPEMVARQRSQMELLQEFLTADKQSADVLISENIQANLYKDTTVGRILERQQRAIHGFSREAKRQGLSQKLLLKHVLANREDTDVVRALVISGQQAFDYQFFLLLSEKIEKREKAGVDVQEMKALRDGLIEIQQGMERQSQEAMSGANSTLREMMAAQDKAEAVRENLDRLDDLFMMVLSANLAQAEEAGELQRLQSLHEVQETIFKEMERQAPPEIRLINQLVRAETEVQRIQLLNENQELIRPELLQLTNSIKTQAEEKGDVELQARLAEIHSMIATKVLT